SPFELTTIEPAEVSAAALRQSDVTVLLNVGDFSSSQASAISDYVEGGGSLLIAPGDRVSPEVFNSQFADIAPATLQGRSDMGFDDYLVIAEFDRRHPILQPLSGDWTARFQGHWSLLPHDNAQVLMQFDNTEAALVEGDYGAGKVILFASSMDLEWNNLPLQGLFLPFVHETLRHLVQQEARQRIYRVGDDFSLAAGAVEVAEVLDPLGNAITFTNDSYVVTATRPGIMRATIDGNEVRYAINILPQESNLARTAVSNLFDNIINPDTDPVQSRQVQTQQLIEELERPQRIWWWILVLVMALVIAEALIANRTYR
ncbi:MAG: glutamine amidotransferase, partial [Gammaproteobacteria bacterium]